MVFSGRQNVGGGRDAGPAGTGWAAAAFPVFSMPIKPAGDDDPEPGAAICQGLTLHHDAGERRLAWRQTAAKALAFTVYQFSGSYLSLAAALDDGAAAGLGPGRCVNVALGLRLSRPLSMFLRLNVETATGRHVLHQALVAAEGRRDAGFDLDGMEDGAGKVRAAWLDIIFSDPRMTEIRIDGIGIEIVPG